jgi:glycosyltransferase involved in cell wall biosynthesis
MTAHASATTSDQASATPSFTILMATYNGARHIEEQLVSLAAQTLPCRTLVVSDDGSSDGTPALVARVTAGWRQRHGIQVIQTEGPRAGFQQNFRHLAAIADAVSGGPADAYGFCDQDDIWHADKLARAWGWLGAQPVAAPALYCGRTRTMSEAGVRLGASPLFARPPSFANALVQSIAGANTMVMNRAAFLLAGEAMRRVTFVSHDWLCYQLVSGAGGHVHYSADPAIDYRQHPRNLVGANSTWLARLKRLRMMAAGRFASWTDQNLETMEHCRDLLTPDARATLDAFAHVRSLPLPSRMLALARSGVYRQTRLGHLGLYLACALKRL